MVDLELCFWGVYQIRIFEPTETNFRISAPTSLSKINDRFRLKFQNQLSAQNPNPKKKYYPRITNSK